MFDQIGKVATKLSANLTKLDSQPISAAALIILVFLDLFVLVSLFDGLSNHTRQLITPDEYIPLHCRNIVIDGNWTEANRLDRIAGLASTYRDSYTRLLEDAGDPS